MGYDVHITRDENWFDNSERQIAADEWLEVVQTDPELRLVKSNGPYFVEWVAHPEHKDAWLDWFEGNITTKNPDEALLKKLLAIATRLHAKVQDDDGNDYTSEEDLSLDALLSRASKLPQLSLILSLVALVGLSVIGVFARSFDQQFPLGTPGRLPPAILLVGIGVISAFSLLLSAIAALYSFAEKLQPRRLAWIATVIDTLVFLTFFIRSK